MNLESRDIVITTPPEIIIPDFQTKKEDFQTKKEDFQTKKEDFHTKKEDFHTKKEDMNRHKSQILRRRQMYFYLETCFASIIICLICYFYLGK